MPRNNGFYTTTYSAAFLRPHSHEWFPGLLSNQGEKSIHFFFHNGSFKEKVIKYGTPKPSFRAPEVSKQQRPNVPVMSPQPETLEF